MKRPKPGWHTLQLHLALLGLSLPAWAAEVTVKNDSFQDGGSAVIVGDFVPGEHAGVRLTSPCEGAIVAVQIAWLEGTPGHPPSIERAIHIYEGSTFPTPGAELALLEAPLLTPGYFNEFRYLDEAQTVPLHVPVAAGQQFYVTLEFENPTDVGGGGPSVIRDVDGCGGGKNVLYAIPGGWLDFCIFLQGDLVIRAVVDCGEPSGACCLPDGSCDTLTASDCAVAGGTYEGDGVGCADVECPQPAGACCFEATSGCLVLEEADCLGAGGFWAGAGTDCDTHVCFPIGACCLPDGGCADELSPEQCAALAGTFMGDSTACAGVECPELPGACCFDTGFCLELVEADCAVAGGTWQGPTTDCSDDDGDGTADVCQSPGGLGDLNCDGAVDGFDIDPFVLALTSSPSYDGYYALYPDCDHMLADCNEDGHVDGFDIDPFVELLTGG